MIQFSVRSNLNETLPRRENRVLEAVQQALNAQLLDEKNEIVTEKLAGGVLQRRSGLLADSVELTETSLSGDAFTGTIQAGGGDAFYGLFQEKGTDRWYPIYPRNKRALAFMPAGSNQRIVVKKVMHPPIQERSFMRSTHDERRARYGQAVYQAVAEALR